MLIKHLQYPNTRRIEKLYHTANDDDKFCSTQMCIYSRHQELHTYNNVMLTKWILTTGNTSIFLTNTIDTHNKHYNGQEKCKMYMCS